VETARRPSTITSIPENIELHPVQQRGQGVVRKLHIVDSAHSEADTAVLRVYVEGTPYERNKSDSYAGGSQQVCLTKY
jgi:hypothetical protein